jgi:hypothetical protein
MKAGPESSIVGNLYADSGIYTVVLGMLVVGAALRWAWLWYLKHSDCIAAQLLYAAALPFIPILLRGRFPDTFSRMLFVVAPILVITLIASSKADRIQTA